MGYVVFRAISNVALRVSTDPDIQFEIILRSPWSPPSRILAAAWDCLVGAWGQAASDLRIEWDSKSTLVAAGVALAAAVCAAALRADRDPAPAERVGGRLLALLAAVIMGLVPTFAIRSFPLTRDFETRYFLPVLLFASCAVVAGLLSMLRPRFARPVLFAFAFLCVDRLVVRAFEEKRLQSGFERFGERVQPFVGDEEGLVVLVSTPRLGVSGEETMAKATYRWDFPQAGRLDIVRPNTAVELFGPRSGCRSTASLRLDPDIIRWPRAKEPIRLVLWDAAHADEPDPEPYFRGCPPH